MIRIGIDPILVTIFGFDIRWYSLIVMAGVLVVLTWVWRQAKRADVPAMADYKAGKKQVITFLTGRVLPTTQGWANHQVEAITSLALWGIPGGIIGSRLVHVIDQLDFYLAHPGAIIGGQGQAIYGAVLGATLAMWLGNKLTTKLSFGLLVDWAAPAILLGQAVGRLANIINGDATGRPTDLPWAFIYTNENSYAPVGVATQPSPIYEIMWDLAMFGIVYKLRGRLKPAGSLFIIYLTLYAIGRFFISYTRVNDPFIVPMLNQAQVISLIILSVTIPFLVMRTRRV